MEVLLVITFLQCIIENRIFYHAKNKKDRLTENI